MYTHALDGPECRALPSQMNIYVQANMILLIHLGLPQTHKGKIYNPTELHKSKTMYTKQAQIHTKYQVLP